MPLGYSAGLLGGVLLALLLAPSQSESRPAVYALAPFLLAALAGRWMLLTFSFATHAPDLIAWTLAGLALALTAAPAAETSVSLRRRQDRSGDEDGRRLLLGGAAVATFGFSLSAAGVSALWLWAVSLACVLALAMALGAESAWRQRLQQFLLPSLLILPAIVANRISGYSAWLAYAWLLTWLLMIVYLLLPTTERRPSLRLLALLLPLILLINLPIFGDIAYKAAILRPADAIARDRYMETALLLNPHDHVLAAGIALTEAQAAPPDAPLTNPQVQRVVAAYERAIRAQPLAPEPVAGYAAWLGDRVRGDPTAASQAFSMFDRALGLSPNDIQTANLRALLLGNTGATQEARAELERLINIDPLYAPSYLHLAELQKAAGRATRPGPHWSWGSHASPGRVNCAPRSRPCPETFDVVNSRQTEQDFVSG